jgi:glycosyltransferase involved in cell wall biosynthesis
MRFLLLWRPWGDSLPAIRSLVREHGLPNVEIIPGRFANMPRWYQAAHVTVAPFTEIERCKPMPNSLVESLACGRPVLVTPEVGLAGMVRESRSGVVVAPHGEGIAEGLDRLRSDWRAHAGPARRLAVRWFSLGRFLEGYRRTYDELTSRQRGP